MRDWLARRGVRIPPATEAEAARLAAESGAPENARRWLRAMLLGVALLTLALFLTSRDAANFQFTSARYLIPLYLATPLFFGVLWEAAKNLSPYPLPYEGRGSKSTSISTGKIVSLRRFVVPELAALGLLWLLASSLYGGAQTLGYSADATRFGSPVVPVDRPIIAFFDAHQITAYYTNDYWACYRVAFETDERLHCAIRGEVGKPNLTLNANRYQPWVDELARTPHPAYLLTLEQRAGSPVRATRGGGGAAPRWLYTRGRRRVCGVLLRRVERLATLSALKGRSRDGRGRKRPPGLRGSPARPRARRPFMALFHSGHLWPRALAEINSPPLAAKSPNFPRCARPECPFALSCHEFYYNRNQNPEPEELC